MPICSTVKRRKKSNAIITQLIRKAPYQLYHIKSKRKIKMKTPQFGILARLSGVYREAHIEMKDCKENLLSSESDRRKRSKKKRCIKPSAQLFPCTESGIYSSSGWHSTGSKSERLQERVCSTSICCRTFCKAMHRFSLEKKGGWMDSPILQR